MSGLFVRCGRGVVPIHFIQDKPGRVFIILQHIKARNTRFLEAVTGIFQRRLAKGLDPVGFHMDMNEHNQHCSTIRALAASANKMCDSFAVI